MSISSSLVFDDALQSAAEGAAPAPLPPASTIDVDGHHKEETLPVALARMVRVTGKTPLAIVREFVSLAFGPGRMSWPDYVNLRLFDDKFYGTVDKKSFLGHWRNHDVTYKISYRHDWHGLIYNKVAALSYLAGCGFPTIPIVAIYTPGVAGSRSVRGTADALRRFLMEEADYPIFGKPAESGRSLGSIALAGARPDTESLVCLDGQEVDVRQFIADIERHYPDGYLFQNFAIPHPAVAAICGARLATLRIVTLLEEAGPVVFRACWKIPAGRNLADNYWRSGNLLGTIDRETVRLTRVVSGAGLHLAEVTHHPDTGTSLIGVEIPGIADAMALATEAARLMRQAPLIGWDIAVTEHGPVIVEMNEGPDLFLNQLAERRGVLDKQLLDNIALQKRKARSHARWQKARLREFRRRGNVRIVGDAP